MNLRKDFYKFLGSHSWPQIAGHLPTLNRVKRKGVCTVGPWQVYAANRSQLPFRIPERQGHSFRLLRPPDRKVGLADATRQTSRIKEFKLSDAIVYSYVWDIRFVLLICLLTGFSFWSFLTSEPLLLKPEALSSPDLELAVRVVKDTFVDHVCSTHRVPSLCDCGEPLNKAAQDLFKPEEEAFDPLDLNKKNRRLRAVSICVASIIISMALAESVSSSGFCWS